MRDAGPAYQWYASDALASSTIQKMTLEEEGCYRRLLDFQWLDGKIPANFDEIRSLLKNISRRSFARIWATVGRCFEPLPDGSGLINPRLNYIREERLAFILERSTSGKKGMAKRWKLNNSANNSAIKQLITNDNSPSPSPSPIPPIVPLSGDGPKYSAEFEQFWASYPKKKGKGGAFAVWKKIHPSVALRERIAASLKAARSSHGWIKEGGQYIPDPERWLKKAGWDDQLETDPGTPRVLHISEYI